MPRALFAATRHSHSLGERIARLPFCACPGRTLLQHPINLLKAESFCLRNEKKDEDKTEEERTAPNKEHIDSKVALILVNYIRRYDGNDTVPKPVGGSGESDALRTDRERVDFTDHYPRCRAPCSSKTSDIEAGEYDQTNISTLPSACVTDIS